MAQPIRFAKQGYTNKLRYSELSRQPLYMLVFLLPLIIFYEIALSTNNHIQIKASSINIKYRYLIYSMKNTNNNMQVDSAGEKETFVDNPNMSQSCSSGSSISSSRSSLDYSDREEDRKITSSGSI